MPYFKRVLCFIVVTLGTNNAFGQYTNIVNSNRPGASKSAFSVGTNVIQLETGAFFVNETRTVANAYKTVGVGSDFAIRYGLLLEPLEIAVEGTYQGSKKTYTSYTTSIKDIYTNFRYFTIGGKYLVFDPKKNIHKDSVNLYRWRAHHKFEWRSLIPAVSIYLGSNIDAKRNPYTARDIEGFSPKLMIILQNNFAEDWTFIANFIQDRIGTKQSDFSYLFTLTHAFAKKWSAFVETQGIKSNFYADNLFRFGAAYLKNKNVQLDADLTFNIKKTPSVFAMGIGVTYRLDFHKDNIATEK